MLETFLFCFKSALPSMRSIDFSQTMNCAVTDLLKCPKMGSHTVHHVRTSRSTRVATGGLMNGDFQF